MYLFFYYFVLNCFHLLLFYYYLSISLHFSLYHYLAPQSVSVFQEEGSTREHPSDCQCVSLQTEADY